MGVGNHPFVQEHEGGIDRPRPAAMDEADRLRPLAALNERNVMNKMISADSHVQEPPELYERIPKSLRHRAPRVVERDLHPARINDLIDLDGTILKVCMTRWSPTRCSIIPAEARRPHATSSLYGRGGHGDPADDHGP